jgi:tetratricopeptide (TPR) repeat protein
MRILVAGDSLGLPRPHRINNYSPNEKELAVAYENTYSSIINRELLEHFKMNPFVEMINRSRRFQTSKNVFDEFTDHLFFYEPDVIIMHVGIVDCWFRENLGGKQMIEKESYKQNILNIIKLLKLRPNCRLIIVGISPTSLKMEKKYPGINREIRLYNQILKSQVDDKTIFYIDMEKYIKIKNPHQYLLLDDHHLNIEGNKLVAEQSIHLIKAFVYSDKGVHYFNNGNLETALDYFQKSFSIHPMYIDNICNLLVLSYQLEKRDLFKQIAEFITSHKITHIEIQNLLSELSN